MRNGPQWLLILMIGFLTGCRCCPDYVPPEIDMPSEWHQPLPEPIEECASENCQWWEKLNDPLLNSLIDSAASQNLDLYIALTRILEARIEQKGGSAYLYPHIDASVTYGHAQFNQKTLSNLLGICCINQCNSGQRNIDLFEAGFDAEWEIDLFGMKAHEACALQAKTEAIENEFYVTWIALSAEIVKNYVELRGLQMRLEVLNKNIHDQQEILDLTEGLITAGFAGTLDKMQAEVQMKALTAQKPLIELAINKNIHRLSILLGYPPGELFAELTPSASLPSMPCLSPIGVPSELLRRRPDIRKAERELAAATEQVASAIAALFPRISLYGFIGDIATLCSSGSFTWFAGPQLLLPIFNSRMLEQDVCLNKLKAQEAVYNYQKTVLSALEEAENAIAALNAELERNRQLMEVVKVSQENYQLALQLYEQGLKNYLEVLAINRAYLSAQDEYLQSQVELLLHFIALYKALGGEWEVCVDS